MKKIDIVKKFKLQVVRNEFVSFFPGVVEVEDWIADLPFVKAHSKPVSEVIRPPVAAPVAVVADVAEKPLTFVAEDSETRVIKATKK